jgi:hypothetical protein
MKKIMVIDDEENIRGLYKEEFTEMGYDVTTVNDDSSLPVIICTAYEEYKHDFGSWCSDAYVVKSSDLSLLRDTVKKILG